LDTAAGVTESWGQLDPTGYTDSTLEIDGSTEYSSGNNSIKSGILLRGSDNQNFYVVYINPDSTSQSNFSEQELNVATFASGLATPSATLAIPALRDTDAVAYTLSVQVTGGNLSITVTVGGTPYTLSATVADSSSTIVGIYRALFGTTTQHGITRFSMKV
jgi:hypothetical protein